MITTKEETPLEPSEPATGAMGLPDEQVSAAVKKSIGIRQAERAMGLANAMAATDATARLVKIQQDAYAKYAGVEPPQPEDNSEDDGMSRVHVGDIHITQEKDTTPPPSNPPQQTSSKLPAWIPAALIASGLGLGGAAIGYGLMDKEPAKPPAFMDTDTDTNTGYELGGDWQPVE